MSPTSRSLLDRLRQAPPDAADWQRLEDIYRPLVRSWAQRVPGIGDEADDLTQEVFATLSRELRSFERRRDGAFRAWLRQITLNRMRAFQKARRKRPLVGRAEVHDFLERLEDPASDLSRQWDREHDRHVFQKLLALVRADFKPATWEAFTRFGLGGHPPARVAEELGLSEIAVVQAKYRVLKRLRQEAGELID